MQYPVQEPQMVPEMSWHPGYACCNLVFNGLSPLPRDTYQEKGTANTPPPPIGFSRALSQPGYSRSDHKAGED